MGVMIKVGVGHGVKMFRKFEGSDCHGGSRDRANINTSGRREINDITVLETRTGNPATDSGTGGKYF